MTAELTGFHGRVAIVTGAGRMRSIGRSIAVGLARAGCRLVLVGTGRPPETYPEEERAAGWRDVDSVAAEIAGLGGTALPLVADIADEDGVEELYRSASALGPADFLVNNAAASRGGDRRPVAELAVSEWDAVHRVNVRGTFLMSRAFVRAALAARRPAAIVNISSIGGKLSGPHTAAYSASKAAVQSLTSSMAKELGPEGIRVNAICPGVVDTSRISDRDPEEWDAYVRATIPMARIGSGDDIMRAALFLLSDQASWITGQSWNVDGGQLTIR